MLYTYSLEIQGVALRSRLALMSHSMHQGRNALALSQGLLEASASSSSFLPIFTGDHTGINEAGASEFTT